MDGGVWGLLIPNYFNMRTEQEEPRIIASEQIFNLVLKVVRKVNNDIDVYLEVLPNGEEEKHKEEMVRAQVGSDRTKEDVFKRIAYYGIPEVLTEARICAACGEWIEAGEKVQVENGDYSYICRRNLVMCKHCEIQYRDLFRRREYQ